MSSSNNIDEMETLLLFLYFKNGNRDLKTHLFCEFISYLLKDFFLGGWGDREIVPWLGIEPMPQH